MQRVKAARRGDRILEKVGNGCLCCVLNFRRQAFKILVEFCVPRESLNLRNTLLQLDTHCGKQVIGVTKNAG